MPLAWRGLKFKTHEGASVRLICSLAVFAVWATTATAQARLEGRVTHVRDVDTIEVGGVAIRLQGLNGPELNERGGMAAQRWMRDLVQGRAVECELTGERNADRLIGVCYLGSADIARMAVAAGHARDCERYSGGRYARFETMASRRHAQRGYCRVR